MKACEWCKRPLVVVCERRTGWPNHHVAGTRREYCPHCGPIPTLTLGIPDEPAGATLVPDGKAKR